MLRVCWQFDLECQKCMYQILQQLKTYPIHIFNQSQRMNPDSPLAFFSPFLDSQAGLLQAHARIAAKFQEDIAEFVPGSPTENTFIGQCLQFLGEETEDNKRQFQIITLLHPIIVESFSSFPTDIQDAVRSSILNCVLARSKHLKSMSALGLLIRQIVQTDNQTQEGFEQWVEPLGELIKWMGSEQPGVAQASVEFFIYFYKENSYNMTNTELPLYKFSSHILPVLFQIFTVAEEEQSERVSLRQKILFLTLQVLKSFSFFDGSDDDIVKNCFEENFQLWMSLFSSILKSSLSLRLGLKKYVIKILVIIYRDMNNFCEKKMKSPNRLVQLLTLWEFSYKFMPLYLASEVWRLKEYDRNKIVRNSAFPYFDEDMDSAMAAPEALAHSILQFLSVLSTSPLLSMVGKVSIYHTVNALFHYYILSNEELRTWTCSQSYFINLPDHESIRGKILNTLNEIIEKNGDYAIQALLVVSQKFLMNYSQAQTLDNINKIMESMGLREILESGRLEINLSFENLMKLTELSGCDIKETLKVRGETWHKSEVALSILGRFAEDIIVFQSRQQGAFDIESFVRGLIKQFEIQQYDMQLCILKGQSLYCLTRFTEIISIKYKDMFCELVASCCTCLDENYPNAVRVAACKTLTIFLRKIEKHKLKLNEQQLKKIKELRTVECIMSIQLTSETNSYALEALIEMIKTIGPECLPEDIAPSYILENIHRNISHSSILKICFNLMELVCSYPNAYSKLIMAVGGSQDPVIPYFIQDCLVSYCNIIKSQQKNYLKALDIDLILTVLRLCNLILEKCPTGNEAVIDRLATITPQLTQIIQSNDQLQIHVATTICLKSMIRLCPKKIIQKEYQKNIMSAIRCLLKIPADKSFEGASIYVGNLSILSFDRLLEKPDQQVLQEVVLKVFKSRTPSVIQSLVLIYSRLMNEKTDASNPFAKGEWEGKVANIIDFLASFSIENRMGLKILIDKWLLQQSLFRGKYTKISTFMALSKLFLVRDKRIDNLLVIGFNPSHTNVNNDVNAPLKILATLIRCLKNEMGGNEEEDDEQQYNQNQFQFKDEAGDKPLDVGLQKFKESEEVQQQQAVGGLADRENQQGSTCYMSAMLQFYDDGEECDETTEDDLIFLKDSSTKFFLKEYLTDFFLYLNSNDCPHHQYFVQCLKELLREDLKTLQKYIKVNV